MLPWDDDIDILLSRKDIIKVSKGFTLLESYQFKMIKHSDDVYKFCDKFDFMTKPLTFCTWPYLDIFIYDLENDTLSVPRDNLVSKLQKCEY